MKQPEHTLTDVLPEEEGDGATDESAAGEEEAAAGCACPPRPLQHPERADSRRG